MFAFNLHAMLILLRVVVSSGKLLGKQKSEKICSRISKIYNQMKCINKQIIDTQ